MCFSGSHQYRDEYDEADPVQFYGFTKREGEKLILSSCDSIVIRTSWLFGIGGTNYVSKLPYMLRTEPKIKLIDNMYGSPTYAGDLAEWTVMYHNSLSGGIYHVTNIGEMSYYELALHVENQLKTGCEIESISSYSVSRPARRPAGIFLQSIMLDVEGIPMMRTSQEAYNGYLEDLNS